MAISISKAGKIGLGTGLFFLLALCAHDLWWFQHPAPCRQMQIHCDFEITSNAALRAMQLGVSALISAIAGVAAWRIFAIARPLLRAFILGLALLFVALVADSVDLAGGRDDYRFALLIAIPCWLGAAVAFGYLAKKGGAGWRVAAAVLALPILFLLADFSRRVPYVFGSASDARSNQ